MADRRDLAWPLGLASMLAAMIAVSVAFFAVAQAHPDAQVVDDPYAAGLAFDEELALLQRARAMGLAIAISTTPAEGGVHARVEVHDRNGVAVVPDSATLRRIRPSQGGYDADFALSGRGGSFEGDVPLPLPGRWRLEARLRVDGRDLVATTDLRSS